MEMIKFNTNSNTTNTETQPETLLLSVGVTAKLGHTLNLILTADFNINGISITITSSL